MYTSGTAFQSNMITHYNRRQSVIKRMLCLNILQFSALEGAYSFIALNTCRLHSSICKLKRSYIVFIIILYKCVFIFGTKTYSEITRYRPCGRCPDNKINLGQINTHGGKNTLIVNNVKLHINRRARIVCILNFCLG